MSDLKTTYNAYQLQQLSYCENMLDVLWLIEDMLNLKMFILKSLSVEEINGIKHDIELLGLKWRCKDCE